MAVGLYGVRLSLFVVNVVGRASTTTRKVQQSATGTVARGLSHEHSSPRSGMPRG